MNRLLAVAAFAFAFAPALAAPPKDADPKMAPFYRGLTTKDSIGASCYGLADCREVDSQSPENSPTGHWRAFIDRKTFGTTAPDAWVDVPDSMVQEKDIYPRPDRAVACWVVYSDYYLGGNMRCFVKPASSI